jgi:Bacterial PH domain
MGSVPVRRRKPADVVGGPQVFRSPTAVVVWWVWLLFAVANLIDLAVQGRDHASAVAAAILVVATGVAYITAQRPRVIADNAGITIVNPLRSHHIGWAGVSKVDLADLLRVHCDTGHGRSKIIYCWAVHYSRRRKLAAENKARRATAQAASGRSSLGLGGLGGFGTFGRGSGGYGGGAGYASAPTSTAEAEAERIVRVLSEYATAARAEAVWANDTVEIAGSKQTGEPGEAGGASKPARAAAPEPAARTEPPATTAGHLPVAGWLDPLTSPWDRKAVLALLIPALILLVVCLV